MFTTTQQQLNIVRARILATTTMRESLKETSVT